MTLMNGIGLALAGSIFIASILTRDWLEGSYTTTAHDKFPVDIIGHDFPSLTSSNWTVSGTWTYEYSLRHFCLQINFHLSPLSSGVHELKKNISQYYKDRGECYLYVTIERDLPSYAKEEIKRYQHVFIYILCTVGLVGVAFVLSVVDSVLARSVAKKVIKFLATALCLLAAIAGMVVILLARIERTDLINPKLDWKYGYSFVLACVAEAILILLLLYNILEYYLRTRKRVAEDCEYLKPEDYPLDANYT